VNPFDLAGPEFLGFYLFVGASVLIVLAFFRYGGEEMDPPSVNLADPYLIAYLRGGKNETIRVATVSLIDRGLLEVSGSTVSIAKGRSAAELRVPLEKSLCSFYGKAAEAASAFTSSQLFETGAYENELIRLDLLPGPQTKSVQSMRLAITIAVLWAIAVVKIIVALQRGRTNIQFLIILAVLFALAAWKIAKPRLTGKGKAMTTSLRTLFKGLKDRAPTLMPGRNPMELLLLAAVFGMSGVPAGLFPYTKTLYPQASSSGSSCGSSCGSGCGGGGCGGGCGGCGS
jgi:uncharacterized protein (TIGR04222 family)